MDGAPGRIWFLEEEEVPWMKETDCSGEYGVSGSFAALGMTAIDSGG
jgi:hypothetical protein